MSSTLKALQAQTPSSSIEEAARLNPLAQLLHDQDIRLHATVGPLHDMLRQSDARAAELHETLQKLSCISKSIDAQFRLPELRETATLAADALKATRALSIRPLHAVDAIAAAMTRMHAPWLKLQNELASAQGFSAIQDLGALLRMPDGFSDDVSSSLRAQLGDWRHTLAIPTGVMEDIEFRTRFYENMGLNPHLTDFTVAAFRESLAIARVDDPPPSIIDFPDYFIPADSPAQAADFERTNAAHDRLMRFETHLRRFIDTHMSSAFGANWPKHRLPEAMRKQWEDKRRKALDRGEKEKPLIAYADFTDYEAIMVRADNWADVFGRVFRRAESLQESLRRLYPIRLCTMHARLITQDDELFMFVEVKRILIAIGAISNTTPS